MGQSYGRRADDEDEVLLLRVRAAAHMLSLSEWQVRAMIHAGQLPCVRFGRRMLVPRAAIEALGRTESMGETR